MKRRFFSTSLVGHPGCLSTSLPSRVTIVEVGARDGIQNEKKILSPTIRAELIHRLVAAGAKVVETGSFVSPKWVPQMASSDTVLAAVIDKLSNVDFPVLTPNMRGYDEAVAAGATSIAIFGSASETFSQKNINCSIETSMQRFSDIANAAKRDGVRVRGYVSCVLGCPYEGKIAHDPVVRLTSQMLDLGCYEVSLGDTIGVGTPGSTQRLLSALLPHVPAQFLAAHFHDTYGQALANLLVALHNGIATIDSSVGGLGGCPYAKGAKGNVATEDVVYMLNGMGIETGMDIDALVDTASWISDILGRPPASRVAQALLSHG